MKFPRRLPHYRSLKFAPFALISLFLFSNLTGLLFSRVMAPDVIAKPDTTFRIPADIPTSGDPKLDRIIYEAGQKEGIDLYVADGCLGEDSGFDYIIEVRYVSGSSCQDYKLTFQKSSFLPSNAHTT